MKTRKMFRRVGSIGLAGSLAMGILLAGAGTAAAGGTRVFVSFSVGRPVFARHPFAHSAVVHRPFVHTHVARPIVIQPVIPVPVIVVPSPMVTPPTTVAFSPPAPVIVTPPSWFWTGSRWEWHTGGHIWVPDRWTWSGSQWVWTRGHWAR